MKFQKTVGYYKWIVFFIDMAIAVSSITFVLLVLSVRFEAPYNWELLRGYLWPALGFSVISHLIFKPHLSIIRNLVLTDLIRLLFTRFVYLVFVLLFVWVYHEFLGGNYYVSVVFVLDAIISYFVLMTFRIGMRWFWSVLLVNAKAPLPNSLIYGAGELGKLAFGSLGKHFNFVGFIDDDSNKNGKYLFGKRIVSLEKLHAFLEGKEVKSIITAIPNLTEVKRKRLVELALTKKIKIQDIPHSTENYNGSLNINQLRNIQIEDLLNREPIEISNKSISESLFGKTILITGAAGSIGSEISRQVLRYWPAKVILFDQAETPMFHLEGELMGLFEYGNIDKQFVIGDITVESDLLRIFNTENVQIVFHAAAYKHVPLMEKNPIKALSVNAWGSSILAEVSLKFEVERFVQISTDKAVNPTNIMGASKRAAEIYVQSLHVFGKTKFITTRFGNVLGSNGSVVPFFKDQITKGGPITVTHPDIERYFMTIPEACSLVLEAGAMSDGGEIFVFDMGKPVKINDLAERMIRLSGLEPHRDIEISYIGLRPGEKLFEELLSNSENTIPTYHNKILIARVDKKPYKDVVIAWEELKQSINLGGQNDAVDWLKRMVPEFESQEAHLFKLLGRPEEPIVPEPLVVSPYLLSYKKRMVDIFLCLLALPFAALILFFTALVYPFFGGSHFFFYHKRMGKDTEEFTMYKVRTLKHNHNNIRAGMNNADGTIVPFIGRILRAYRIDELPQIWNIIKGEMSWVGPRPEQIKVAKSFMADHSNYVDRYLVLPGITGLAQVDDPNAVLDDFEEKLYHDIKYIETATVYLDLYLLYKSVSVIFGSIKRK